MSLLIKNGEIVTASERYVTDIFCENETITRIDKNIKAPSGTEVIGVINTFARTPTKQSTKPGSSGLPSTLAGKGEKDSSLWQKN